MFSSGTYPHAAPPPILMISIMPDVPTTSQDDPERILAVMEPGRQYSTSTLATACRIPLSRMQPSLRKLVDARRIVPHVNRKERWPRKFGQSGKWNARGLSRR